REIRETKAVTAKNARFAPYSKFENCRICKQKVHQKGSSYCQCKFTDNALCCLKRSIFFAENREE
ncbi:cysteine-rich PDZ-binding protein-like isoform X2, partial [Dinothrombium tinctorium]